MLQQYNTIMILFVFNLNLYKKKRFKVYNNTIVNNDYKFKIYDYTNK